MKRDSGPSQRTGFALVEVAMAGALLALLAAAAAATMHRAGSLNRAIHEHDAFFRRGTAALRGIVEDIRRSSFRPSAGVSYPAVTDVTVTQTGQTHRQMAFLVPRDANGDRIPDLSSGSVLWSSTPVTYGVDHHHGRTRLLRTQDGQPRVVLDSVQSVRFDTPESSGWTVPFGCVRIEISLLDPSGRTRALSAVVRLLNS